MSSSGTYLFNPTIAETVDEAFERCQVDPERITLRHITSARRSMNLMFADWASRGVMQWAIDQQTQPLTQGQVSFTMPVGTIDVFSMVLRRNGFDTEMYPIGKDEYLKIPSKAITGRPNRFLVDRQIPQPVCYIWQTSDQTTDAVIYYRMRQLQDVNAAGQTADIPYLYQDAMAAGLAARLAVKFAPMLKDTLLADAEAAFARANVENRERGRAVIQPKMG